MARKKPDLVRRRQAVEATMAKYRGKGFDWGKGVTCVHALRFHLKRLGKKVPRVPKLAGPEDARAELRKHGWSSVAAMLDGIGLERIAPAAMRLGDVAVFDGTEALAGVVISVGGKVIGWHEDYAEMQVMDLVSLADGIAWRV